MLPYESNEQFHQACEQWLQGALQLLRDKPLTHEEDMEVTFTPNGYQTHGGIYKVDLGRLYINYHEELLRLPEYETVENIVLQTPSLVSTLCMDAGGIVHPEIGIQRHFIERCLLVLLTEYFRTTQDFSFKIADFEGIYAKLEQFVYSTEPFDAVCLVDIRNLVAEVNTIRLDRGVILRQATHDEKVGAVKTLHNPIFRSVSSEVPDTFLEILQPADRVTPLDLQIASTIAQSAVLALRLIEDNPIGLVSYSWDVPEQPFRLNKGGMQSPLVLPSAFRGERYSLTQDEATILPKLYKKAKRAYRNSEITTAITRFEDSYTRIKLEDKLIDYWVALEALFFSLIPKEYVGSMGETVASNIAYYISKTESERRSIYAFIYSSHKVRGYFVHGQRGTAPEHLNLTIKKTEQYLRTALRKCIEE